MNTQETRNPETHANTSNKKRRVSKGKSSLIYTQRPHRRNTNRGLTSNAAPGGGGGGNDTLGCKRALCEGLQIPIRAKTRVREKIKKYQCS